MWYSVSVLFEGVHPSGPAEDNLWEESILLIDAVDESGAVSKATEIAKTKEVSFAAAGGDHVQWRFSRIERVFEVDDSPIASGSEVFSRFLRASEVRSLLTPFKE